MTTDETSLNQGAFADLKARKRAKKAQSLRDKRGEEVRGSAHTDGRVRTTVDSSGRAQFNVRSPVDLKNRIIEEARKTGRDINEVVVEALELYLDRLDAGGSR